MTDNPSQYSMITKIFFILSIFIFPIYTIIALIMGFNPFKEQEQTHTDSMQAPIVKGESQAKMPVAPIHTRPTPKPKSKTSILDGKNSTVDEDVTWGDCAVTLAKLIGLFSVVGVIAFIAFT